MIYNRNQLSHIYEEEIAQEISVEIPKYANFIKNIFLKIKNNKN